MWEGKPTRGKGGISAIPILDNHVRTDTPYHLDRDVKRSLRVGSCRAPVPTMPPALVLHLRLSIFGFTLKIKN